MGGGRELVKSGYLTKLGLLAALSKGVQFKVSGLKFQGSGYFV